MKFNEKRNGYILSSGREVYANHGLLSIIRDDDEPGGFEVGEGYDGTVAVDGIQDWSTPGAWSEPPWTPEERAEVADHMIALWQSFKDATPEHQG